jgi:hypothetical protein
MTDNTPPTPPEPVEPPPPVAVLTPAADGGSPPVPPATRRTPMWVWGAGILIGLLVIVLIVVAVIRGDASDISSATSTPSAATSVPPSAEDSAEPEASTEPAPEPGPSDESEPAEAGAGVDLSTLGDENGFIALDTFADFETDIPAIWNFPTPADWDLIVFDQEGQNVISNESLSCMYSSVQNRQPAVDLSGDGDFPDSELSLSTLEAGFRTQFQNATVTRLDNVDLSWGVAKSPSKMEFLSTRVDYLRADTGEAYSTIVALRATPQMDGVLYVTMNCPSGIFGSEQDPTQEMLDRTAVMPAYF